MKEALLYEKLKDQVVKCYLCAHYCTIREGKRGVCKVRENRGGILYSRVYHKLISQAVDPVEKKPLYHFLPGSRAYSIATVGCNFRCRWCQNWRISQYPRLEEEIPGSAVDPDEIVQGAINARCQSIAYTYTEPTVYFEYMLETMRIAKEKGLRNLIISNGFFSPQALRIMIPYLDGANIDMKTMDEGIARKMIKGGVAPILDNLKELMAAGIWTEVTTLIVPGVNDREDQLAALAGFIAEELGADIPWHISRFYPHYKMSDVAPTSEAALQLAYQIGKDLGIRFIYFGNIGAGTDTICPVCGEELIKRRGYSVAFKGMDTGKCSNCGEVIQGVWS